VAQGLTRQQGEIQSGRPGPVTMIVILKAVFGGKDGDDKKILERGGHVSEQSDDGLIKGPNWAAK